MGKIAVIIVEGAGVKDVGYVDAPNPDEDYYTYDLDMLVDGVCQHCWEELSEGTTVCTNCGIDWSDFDMEDAKALVAYSLRKEECQHQEDEDHLICAGCGRCREDLDEDDYCIECGGESDHELKFYFPVTLIGTGYNSSDAWNNAVDGFAIDPGIPPDGLSYETEE